MTDDETDTTDEKAKLTSTPHPPNSRHPRFHFASMKILNNRWFLLVLRIALGGIFLYAGTTKVVNPQAFADSIATFKMLPPQLINIVALGLPPFEILLGLMLLSGLKTRAASLAVAGLAIIFGLALGQALIRGLAVDCGCFGSGGPSALKTWISFGRAFLLFAASFWVFKMQATDNTRVENVTKL